MHSKKDESFGVIPYSKKQSNLYFFLIEQYSDLRNDVYWVFPKGHAEEGESSQQAALRECKEETGLLLKAVNEKATFLMRYDFTHKNMKVHKTVTYFLAEVEGESYSLQEKEVKSAGWFLYEDARKRLTYENARQVLDSAYAYLMHE